MSNSMFLRASFLGGEDEMVQYLFGALMSDDPDDLEEAIDRVNDDGGWSDDFRYDLEGLHSYRSFYDEERLAELTPEQRELVEEYDDEWTMDLVHQLHQHQFETPEGDSPELRPS